MCQSAWASSTQKRGGKSSSSSSASACSSSTTVTHFQAWGRRGRLRRHQRSHHATFSSPAETVGGDTRARGGHGCPRLLPPQPAAGPPGPGLTEGGVGCHVVAVVEADEGQVGDVAGEEEEEEGPEDAD